MIAEGATTAVKRARALGLHHVVIDVGDIDEALDFYGRLIEFEVLDKTESSAYLDLVDQFLLLQKNRTCEPREGRHIGVVVDDKRAVSQAMAAAGITAIPGAFLRFRDPWGNRIEIISYD
jgi:catechol 2,3-dioxygenase-like lactoylglutathione lyase family enzyme